MDVYRKAGRGGAGNFYSPKDIAQAQAQASASSSKYKELEAQKMSPSNDADIDPPTTDEPAKGPLYGRSGRGGAGNFVEPPLSSSPSSSTGRGVVVTAPAPATVHNAGAPRAAGHNSGRGGAGNWAWASDEKVAAVVAEELKRKADLDAQVFDAVKAGLPEPQRAYHMDIKRTES